MKQSFSLLIKGKKKRKGIENEQAMSALNIDSG
jgi:hypothetical protein